MVYITIVKGGYKPTNIAFGGPQIPWAGGAVSGMGEVSSLWPGHFGDHRCLQPQSCAGVLKCHAFVVWEGEMGHHPRRCLCVMIEHFLKRIVKQDYQAFTGATMEAIRIHLVKP